MGTPDAAERGVCLLNENNNNDQFLTPSYVPSLREKLSPTFSSSSFTKQLCKEGIIIILF